MVDDGGVGAWGATACREPPAPTRVGPPRAAGTSTRTSRAEVDSFLEANQVMREPGQADRAARARLGRKPRPEEAAALCRQSWANGRCNSKQEVRTDGRAWQAEGQRRLCASGAATSWALCCCRWGRQPWPDGSVGPGGSIQWEGKGRAGKRNRGEGAASGYPPFGVVSDAPTRHVRPLPAWPGSSAHLR